jgi:anti-sigma factor RsiW
MPCESYKPALTVAAAEKTAPSRELAAHLGACASCRAFFATERQLFAAVDSGVSAAANSAVPASLLPQVRVRLDEQKLSSFSWIRMGALLAGAALVLASVLVLQRVRSTSRESVAPANTAARNPASKSLPTPVLQDAGPEKQIVERVSLKLRRRQLLPRPQAAAESAVLVPPGQREAVNNLLAALSKGTVKADDLLVPRAASVSANGELVPLGIPEIEIKPLAVVSEDSAPTQ